MKLLIFVLCVYAVSARRIVREVVNEQGAQIVKAAVDVQPDSFGYSYETSNGISGQASGTVQSVGDQPFLGFQGSYSYVDDSGKQVSVQYVADENGYRAQGDVIPTPHPIPDYIQKSLDFIRAHPPVEKKLS